MGWAAVDIAVIIGGNPVFNRADGTWASKRAGR